MMEMSPQELRMAANTVEKFMKLLSRDFYRLTREYGMHLVKLMRDAADGKSPKNWPDA